MSLSIAVPLVVVGALLALLIVVGVLTLRDPEASKRRVEAFFRRAPKPPKPPVRTTTTPYWSWSLVWSLRSIPPGPSRAQIGLESRSTHTEVAPCSTSERGASSRRAESHSRRSPPRGTRPGVAAAVHVRAGCSRSAGRRARRGTGHGRAAASAGSTRCPGPVLGKRACPSCRRAEMKELFPTARPGPCPVRPALRAAGMG